jgi:nucleoside diphosphate kinase
MFKEAKNPVVQFVATGPYAIAKLKQIIGHREPKLAAKDSMRSFYGVDRLDNAYFISENFSEALIERDFLFTSSATPASL